MKTYTEIAEAVFAEGDRRLYRKNRRRRRAAAGAITALAVLLAAFLAVPGLRGLITGNRKIALHFNDTQPTAAREEGTAQKSNEWESLAALLPEDVRGCFLFDPNDKRLLTGASHYVIAARVSEVKEVTDEAQAAAEYAVRYERREALNLYNVKGSLTLSRPMELWIAAGIYKNGAQVLRPSPLPGEAGVYVLYLICGADGRLYLRQAFALAAEDAEDIEAALRLPEHPAHALLAECLDAFAHEDRAYAPEKRVSPYEEAEGGDDT